MIDKLQAAMLEMPQMSITTIHKFCNGVYAREIHIPEGVVLVGAKHKTSFFLTVSSGSCLIIDGETETTLTAPCMIISEVGAKRAILALKDTILTTFHPTDKTDVDEIEKDIIEPEGLKIANNPKELLE